MKIMKYLLAAAAVSCVFTATALAAPISNTNDYTFSLSATPAEIKAGDTVSVSVYLKDTTTNEPISLYDDDQTLTLSIGLNYNKDVLTWADTTAKSVATETGMAPKTVFRKVKDNVGNLGLVYSGLYGSEIDDVAADTALVTYTFTVNADVKSATYDASNPLFALVSGSTSLANADTFQETANKTMGTVNTITVVGASTSSTTVDTPVAGKDMYEQKTFVTKISFKNVESQPKAVVALMDGTTVVETQEYDLPNVVGGTTDLIGIIRYMIGQNGVEAGNTFKLTIGGQEVTTPVIVE